MAVRKGDTVLVIAGKEKGKRGAVLKVLTKTQRVIVEGVNMRKRHQKPTQANPRGGILEFPGSMHRSNVLLIEGDTAVRADKRGAVVAKKAAPKKATAKKK